MKIKIIILVALALIAKETFAINYYVSNAGNDYYSGKIESTPWKSLKGYKLHERSAGDTVFFRRGDIFTYNFNEMLSFYGKDGTLENPIVLSSYGDKDKEKPVISGFNQISKWGKLNDSIYFSTIKTVEDLNCVLFDDKLQRIGQFPNNSYCTFDSSLNDNKIYVNSINKGLNFNGGEISVMAKEWYMMNSKITAYSNNEIYFDNLGTNIREKKFIIQNHINTLDQLGEWYFTNDTLFMYFGSEDPYNHRVKYSVVNNLVEFGGADNIKLENLIFEGANNKIINGNGNLNAQIENCEIRFSGGYGVTISNNNSLIINCKIRDTHDRSLVVYASNVIVKGNYICNAGLSPGMARFSGEEGVAGVVFYSYPNCILENNYIDSIAWSGIHFRGDNILIKNNYVNHYCIRNNDGGGIYCGGSSINNLNNRRVLGNIIHIPEEIDNKYNTEHYNHGIYLDNKSTEIIVENNIITNATNGGIFIHDANKNIIKNNIVYNCRYGISAQSDYIEDWSMRGNVVKRNFIFASDQAVRFRFWRESGENIDKIEQFGIIDSNSYFIPINQNVFHVRDIFDKTSNEYSLSVWSEKYNYDKNSKLYEVKPKLVYNNDKIIKEKFFAGYMVDPDGDMHHNSVKLNPFKGLLLLPISTGTVVIDTLSLKKGLNYVSFDNISLNDNLSEIFKDIIKSGVSLKIMDEKGRVFENAVDNEIYNEFSNELENFQTLKIIVGEPVKVKYEGMIKSTNNYPFEINLEKGWNILPFANNDTFKVVLLKSLLKEQKVEKIRLIDQEIYDINYSETQWISDVLNDNLHNVSEVKLNATYSNLILE
ncbi:right-handed parallel beta-helix repeat-containing protein [Saccharicrinis sp. FJH2]|uniref:right-handed parallel beta-helix repeat-containing protein n=1 Tax=Saccharicrinis sp. FJH65 TaxID=3344659 RepID=UPI0035F3F71C